VPKFFEVVEFLDDTGEEIVHRVPEAGSGEFNWGSQLVVRESQAAVFFKNGKALDTFGPGRYTLHTYNLPLLVALEGLAFAGKSPFRTGVYFVNLKTFLGQKWGTPVPIAYRDAELQVVRLRAFGTFAYRVVEPRMFLNDVVGTQARFTNDAILELLRSIILQRLSDTVPSVLTSVFDLPSHYTKLSEGIRGKAQADFRKRGLELDDLVTASVTPPAEVQQVIDERSGVLAAGDLDDYMKFQAANAITESARQNGGIAGLAVGAGISTGLAASLPALIQHSIAVGPAARCPHCSSPIQVGSLFCSWCGASVEPRVVACSKCGAEMPEDAKFCPGCGREATRGRTCSKCGRPLPAKARFCPDCGAQATS
jgi:membrane protease subunit (stomatin/prohibitin family)